MDKNSDEMRPIAGTKAAKLLGIRNNSEFVRLFMDTGKIRQIVFKGRKRSLYDPEDVARLVEFNKKSQPKKSFSVALAERFIRQYQEEFQ